MQHPDFKIPELPLKNIKYDGLNKLIINANRELAKYDGLIQNISNPEILLWSLTTSESVSSSRIEWTQTSFSEIVRYQDSLKNTNENFASIQEVINYKKALIYATEKIQSENLSLKLIKQIHSILLDWVRWENKDRWNFRNKQNWIWVYWSTPETAEYLPPAPDELDGYLNNLEQYFSYDDYDPLVQTAIIHCQFESIHPFLDWNGRVGRLLIPLFLYSKWLLSYPSFYMSEYFEYDKYEYINSLRKVTHKLNWEWWIEYFLNAVIWQVYHNTQRIKDIQSLYESMKRAMNTVIHSPKYIEIIDFLFKKPIFTVAEFIDKVKLSKVSSYKYLNSLQKEWFLDFEKNSKIITYKFKLLMDILE